MVAAHRGLQALYLQGQFLDLRYQLRDGAAGDRLGVVGSSRGVAGGRRRVGGVEAGLRIVGRGVSWRRTRKLLRSWLGRWGAP